MQSIEENKMGVMPVNKLLISMSLPIIISMLIQALYNVVDSIFVSKLNVDALNAVSLSFPIQNLIIAVAVGTGVGINALLSKSLGEKNYDRVNKTALNGIFLALVSYFVFLIFGLLFVKNFFATQTTNENILKYGTDYLTVCTVFSAGIFFQIILERLLQATGRSFYTMVAHATAAIINIILDPILIFGLFGFPRLEVKGAAIATVIAQTIGASINIYFNLTKNSEINFSLKNFKLDSKIIKRIYSVGIPSIVMQSIVSFVIFYINGVLISFTEVATAVFGAFFKLQSFVFMPVFGINNGMVPIVAFNYGAKKKDRIIETIKLSVIYSMTFMIFCFLIIETFPAQLLGFFNPSEEMIKIGVPALRILSVAYLFAGFSIVTVTSFQALGNGMLSLIVSVTRQLVVLVPAVYFLSLTGKLELVWWAFPIAEFACIIMSMFFVKVVYDKEIKNL